MACLDGHFPALPIMPAVAQIALLQALIREHSGWQPDTISAGKQLKFTRLIQPGDPLAITLQRQAGTVRFSISHTANADNGPASSGTLTLSGAPHG